LDLERLRKSFTIHRIARECEVDFQPVPYLTRLQVRNLFWSLEARRLWRAHAGAAAGKPRHEQAGEQQGETNRTVGRLKSGRD
jgi:hypothetical protein